MVRERFELTGRVALITGGAGRLGVRHAEAVAEMGAIPVLVDLDREAATAAAARIAEAFGTPALGLAADITSPDAVRAMVDDTLAAHGRIDILINNAAHNPAMGGPPQAGESAHWSRFEGFALGHWERDLAVGLTGAFLVSQAVGARMAAEGRGVILNIASDLGLIAPDQRIYRQPGLPEAAQPVKPVTYSVVKHGLIGLTRYLATYWAGQGVRANAICPGGVYDGHDEAFVAKLTNLIPLGRMADADEYKAAVVFLVSDASSYMTGAVVAADGGRSTW
ncbi:MAG: SDR family oxidoreductase [Vicinamibacterales bacterium]